MAHQNRRNIKSRRRRTQARRHRRCVLQAAIVAGMTMTIALTAAASSTTYRPILAAEADVETTTPATSEICLILDEPEPPTEAVTAECGAKAAKAEEIPAGTEKAAKWGAQDAEMLLRLAMAEAEGESTEGKALVMRVVLNRVASQNFPDSIESVIFEKSGGSYQFSSVIPGGRYWKAKPDEDCHKALTMVENGWDESQGATFFEATYNTSTWHKKHLKRLFEYGGHIFYSERG